jgi:hypothetical protein
MAIVVIAIVTLGSGRLFRKTRQYVMYFSGSVNGLLVGAAVKMEGVPVGAVKEIRLGFNPRGEPVEDIPTKVKIAVIVELDEKMLRARRSQHRFGRPTAYRARRAARITRRARDGKSPHRDSVRRPRDAARHPCQLRAGEERRVR